MRLASRLLPPVMGFHLFHVAVPQHHHSRILLHDDPEKLRWAKVPKQAT